MKKINMLLLGSSLFSIDAGLVMMQGTPSEQDGNFGEAEPIKSLPDCPDDSIDSLICFGTKTDKPWKTAWGQDCTLEYCRYPGNVYLYSSCGLPKTLFISEATNKEMTVPYYIVRCPFKPKFEMGCFDPELTKCPQHCEKHEVVNGLIYSCSDGGLCGLEKLDGSGPVWLNRQEDKFYFGHAMKILKPDFRVLKEWFDDVSCFSIDEKGQSGGFYDVNWDNPLKGRRSTSRCHYNNFHCLPGTPRLFIKERSDVYFAYGSRLRSYNGKKWHYAHGFSCGSFYPPYKGEPFPSCPNEHEKDGHVIYRGFVLDLQGHICGFQKEDGSALWMCRNPHEEWMDWLKEFGILPTKEQLSDPQWVKENCSQLPSK